MINATVLEYIAQVIKPQIVKALNEAEKAVERGELDAYALIGIQKLKEMFIDRETSLRSTKTRG